MNTKSPSPKTHYCCFRCEQTKSVDKFPPANKTRGKYYFCFDCLEEVRPLFEEARQDKDNEGIMYSCAKKFWQHLGKDTCITCALRGLWMALLTHKPQKSKFLTHLHNRVYYECMYEMEHNTPPRRYESLKEVYLECVQCRAYQQELIDKREQDRQHHNAKLISLYFSILNDREQEILTKYYWYGLNQQAIGNDLGVSNRRIQQIMKAAFNKIRIYVRGEELCV